MKLFLFLLLVFEVLSPSFANAGVTVTPPDTVLERGSGHMVPLFGKIDNVQGAQIEIKIVFNAAVIDFKRIVQCSECSLESATFSVDMSKQDSSILTLGGNIKTGLSDGKLCVFELQGLVGPDTVTLLKPFQVKIDGKPETQTELNTGKIKINSVPVLLELTEGFGVAYPNPFPVYVTVPFSISRETEVKFYIYNMLGSLYTEFSENKAIVTLFDESKKKIDFPENNVFQRGKYFLDIAPSSLTAGSGAYHLLMVTSKGTYSVGLMLYR